MSRDKHRDGESAGRPALHDLPADREAIDGVAAEQLIERVCATRELTALAETGSCHSSTLQIGQAEERNSACVKALGPHQLHIVSLDQIGRASGRERVWQSD